MSFFSASPRIGSVVVLIASSVVAVAAATSGIANAAQSAAPPCATVDFGGVRLVGQTGAQNVSDEVPFELADGTYEVLLTSSDSAHPGQADQPNERWILEALGPDDPDGAVQVVFATAPSSDLPSTETSNITNVGTYTATGVVKVRARHAQPSTATNSVQAVRATFVDDACLVAEPSLEDLLLALGLGSTTETDRRRFPPGDYRVELLAEFTSSAAENGLSTYEAGTENYEAVFTATDGGFGLLDDPPIKDFQRSSPFGLAIQLGTESNAPRRRSEADNPSSASAARVFEVGGVPDTWIVGFEDYADGDHQDMVLRLTRVRRWTDQGPSPITVGIVGVGQVNLQPDSTVTGSVEALAPHPTKRKVLFAATSNGGVWRTINADAADPADIDWVPLTDHLPSLSMSAIAFSGRSGDDTLYAGTGVFSAGCTASGDCPDGGPGIGLLRSTDFGETWEVLGRSTFGARRIRSVVPTGLEGDGGEVVLVAAVSESADAVSNPVIGGLFRSEDDGETWRQLGPDDGLPAGGVSHLVQDPNDANRLFAAIPAFTEDFKLIAVQNSTEPGIYRSDDGGQTWASAIGVTPRRQQGRPGIANYVPSISLVDLGGSQRIELAICCEESSDSALYVAILQGAAGITNGWNDLPVSLYRSVDLGQFWTEIPRTNPLNVGLLHFSMLADQRSPDVLYLNDRTGGPRRLDLTKGDPWSTSRPFLSTRPHVDSRDLQFDLDGSLLDANDGGVAKMTNPAIWWSTCVDREIGRGLIAKGLAPADLHTTPRSEAVNELIDDAIETCLLTPADLAGLGGTPGTAEFRQNVVDLLNAVQEWRSVNGDLSTIEAFSMAVDNMGDTNPTNDMFLVGTQDNGNAAGNQSGWASVTGGDGWWARADDAGSHYFSFNSVRWQRRDRGGALLSSLSFIRSGPEVQLATNSVDARRILAAEPGVLYESDDMGSTHTLPPTDELGVPRSIVYGGSDQGRPDADIAYVGSSTGILRRDPGGTRFNQTNFATDRATNLGDGSPLRRLDIAVNPLDHRFVYAVDEDDVFASTDAGDHWILLTGNLRDLVRSPISNLPVPAEEAIGVDILTSISFVTNASGTGDLYVGGFGGVYRLGLTSAVLRGGEAEWSEYGADLPNAKVRDMEYDVESGTLAVATYGRGVWTISPD